MTAYSVLLIAGIGLSFAMWTRMARRDRRLPLIFFAALVGAFVGAKVVYLAAEGWMFLNAPDRWRIWATGKTIVGALLGGYGGVELAKKALHYVQPTGDWFALIVPCGVVVGRVGCLLHGCCLGRVCQRSSWTMDDASGLPRWPAVPLEIVFNIAALGSAIFLQRKNLYPGQHFHFYLIAYGLFRFIHEWGRDTPRVVGGLSGYHFAALAVSALGVVAWVRRQRSAYTRHLRHPVA